MRQINNNIILNFGIILIYKNVQINVELLLLVVQNLHTKIINVGYRNQDVTIGVKITMIYIQSRLLLLIHIQEIMQLKKQKMARSVKMIKVNILLIMTM